VVPSRDRRESLERVLEGLVRQTVPAAQIEVVVALDGPTDDSAAMLDRWCAERRLARLRWLEQPRGGQAAARNAGAALATTPVVIFLDDDIVPEPGLVAAHLAHHAASQSIAVLGDSVFVRHPRDAFYPMTAWAWWEDLFHDRADPAHVPASRDLCAGNFSVRREDFLRVGGFDIAFSGYGGEDYELGYRLQRAGVRFAADRSARALHHHRADLVKVLRNTRQEAHGDVLLGTKHPELRAGLRLAQPLEAQTRILARVAIQAPWLGDIVVGTVVRLLPWLERRKLRRRWFRLSKLARNYAYWRGTRDVLGSWGALEAWRAAVPAPPRIALDVTYGIPDDLDLSPDGPTDVEVAAHGRVLGVVRVPGPFTAPPRRHVAEHLAKRLGPQLAAARRDAGPAPWYLDPAALVTSGPRA
jgi:GT2 family glycosyltransferase